jgi:hypothetical protein
MSLLIKYVRNTYFLIALIEDRVLFYSFLLLFSLIPSLLGYGYLFVTNAISLELIDVDQEDTLLWMIRSFKGT